MKKFRRILVVAALLFTIGLTSCGKTVTCAEAQTFSEENWTETTPKRISTKVVTNVSKAEGVFAPFFEVGKTEDTHTSTTLPFSPAEIALLGELYEYKVSGTSMNISYKGTVKEWMEKNYTTIHLGKDDKVSGSVKVNMQIDAQGYLVKSEQSVDISFDISRVGLTIKGALKVETKTTVTFVSDSKTG
ncbi:hypothetical protein GX831_01535 [bacterium]|jgi:hypothetical protein|nr:hypothetical protein [bacterium]